MKIACKGALHAYRRFRRCHAQIQSLVVGRHAAIHCLVVTPARNAVAAVQKLAGL